MKYNEKYFERKRGYRCIGGYSKIKVQLQRLFISYLRFAENYCDVLHGRGKKALDVGCAYGYLLDILRTLGYKVYGVDVSEYAISKSRHLLGENAVLVVHDVLKPLPFDLKFDLITCFGVLEHVEEPGVAIENCFDALKNRGLFIATTPNKVSLHNMVMNMVTKSYHISVKSKSEWKILFSKFDWSFVKIFGFLPLICSISRHFVSAHLIGSLYIIAQK